MCRLLKYMISFNPKAHSVYTLVHYWARVNKIRLASFMREQQPCRAKEPAALEWLLACFLGSKKVIPTPRQVTSRGPRDPLYFSNLDIGFVEDEKFVSQWKRQHPQPPSGENQEHFVLNILQLVSEFFAFLSRLATRRFVVNTKDGELVEKKFLDDFAAGMPVNIAAFTKLTREEMAMVCFDEKKSVGNKKVLAPKLMGNNELIIIHPFLWHTEFSFKYENFLANISKDVKRSREKIEGFLASYDGASQQEVDLKSLLHL